MCKRILTERSKELHDIAEYLLEYETMEAEEFNYYFEYGEFMPISTKKIREARNDDTIERLARHISMTDGYEELKNRCILYADYPLSVYCAFPTFYPFVKFSFFKLPLLSYFVSRNTTIRLLYSIANRIFIYAKIISGFFNT